MDFVHQHDLVANLAEFVFRIDKNQALLGRDFGAALEEFSRNVFNLSVILLADEAFGDDVLARDVLVVAFVGLGGRGDDRLGETLVLLHAVRNLHATDGVLTALVGAP